MPAVIRNDGTHCDLVPSHIAVAERLPNASNILLVWSPCVAMDGDKKDESAIPAIVTEVMLEASCLKC